ncbi:insulinase family protein, partial [Streptomyces sp. NPDC058301]
SARGAPAAGPRADPLSKHPPPYRLGLFPVRVPAPSPLEPTAAVVSAFPVDRLVTVLVGDAAQIEEPVKALGIGEVTVVAG